MSARKVINSVVKIITPILSVNHGLKNDGSDFYYVTLDCQTLDKYKIANNIIKSLEFRAKVFYNPNTELTTTTAPNYKKILQKISSGKIKNGSILYLSGVAENGGLLVKNPIYEISNCDTLKENESGYIFGTLSNIQPENNLIQIYTHGNINKIQNIGLTPNVLEFLDSLPKDEITRKNVAVGTSPFLFNVKKYNNFLYATEIQNVDHSYFVEKILTSSKEETSKIYINENKETSKFYVRESTQFHKSYLQLEKKNYFNSINELLNGIFLYLNNRYKPKADVFILKDTPQILKKIGYEDLEFSISTYVKEKEKNKHHMTNNQILNTIRKLENPLLIFKSNPSTSRSGTDKSFIIITDEIASNNELFGITFYPNEPDKYAKNGKQRNILTSIHQRTLIANNGNNSFEEYIKNDLCLYVNDIRLSEIKKDQSYRGLHGLMPIHAYFIGQSNSKVLLKSKFVNKKRIIIKRKENSLKNKYFLK